MLEESSKTEFIDRIGDRDNRESCGGGKRGLSGGRIKTQYVDKRESTEGGGRIKRCEEGLAEIEEWRNIVEGV